MADTPDTEQAAAAAATNADTSVDCYLRPDVEVVYAHKPKYTPSLDTIKDDLLRHMSNEELTKTVRALEDAATASFPDNTDAQIELVLGQLSVIANMRYKMQQAESAKKDLLDLPVQDFPLYRWHGSKKEGLRAGVNADTKAEIKSMQRAIKLSAKELGATGVAPYTFLTQTDKVTEVLNDNWSHWVPFLKFLEVIGHTNQQDYWTIFLTEKHLRHEPVKSVPTMTAEEATEVRKEIHKLKDTVYKFLDTDEAKDGVHLPCINWAKIQSLLLGLFMLGDDFKWVPVRCDPALLEYMQADLDVTKVSHIISTSPTECTITYPTQNKVNPTGTNKNKETIVVDVGKNCPSLADLLWKLKPISNKIALNKGHYGPFFMYQQKKSFGKQIACSNFSKRGCRLTDALGLREELAKKFNNVTSARYSSAQEDELCSAENEERCIRRAQRPTMLSAAVKVYQTQADTGQAVAGDDK